MPLQYFYMKYESKEMKEPFKEISEEQLAVMAKNGDGEAAEYLIRKYKDLVRGKARMYFIVGADSEDIVQEGMIGIFKAIKSFDPTRQASFQTFAEICVNRQIIDAVRMAGRMKHSPLNESVSLDKPLDGSEESTLSDTIKDREPDLEDIVVLNCEMDKLLVLGKEIFSELELKVWNEYLKGRTYPEIAEITGKSVKAVDNALQRTRRKLELYLGIEK